MKKISWNDLNCEIAMANAEAPEGVRFEVITPAARCYEVVTHYADGRAHYSAPMTIRQAYDFIDAMAYGMNIAKN